MSIWKWLFGTPEKSTLAHSATTKSNPMVAPLEIQSWVPRRLGTRAACEKEIQEAFAEFDRLCPSRRIEKTAIFTFSPPTPDSGSDGRESVLIKTKLLYLDFVDCKSNMTTDSKAFFDVFEKRGFPGG